MKKKTKIEIIDNNCFECAYCARHYYNLNGTFRFANCMHCTNGNITVRARKNRTANKIKCEYWQPEEIQIEQRRNNIELYLSITAKKLQEIALILKEDNERNK